MKLLIMSDVHLCHQNWYGVPSPERMDKMIADLNRSYEKEPYEAILFLGDYSLDHWVYDCGGSYLHEGISNAANLKKEYLPRLICQNYYMIPGNHEQYGEEKWKEITGMSRQFSVVTGGVLFLMLDNFAGNLDPEADSDGTYTGPDLAYIKEEMQKYPDLPVVLCAHYFDAKADSTEFQSFVREEKRIVCLFCGHDHGSQTENYAGKMLYHDGNYSFALNDISDDMWGWREVYLEEGGLKTDYFTPETKLQIGNRTVCCADTKRTESFLAFAE